MHQPLRRHQPFLGLDELWVRRPAPACFFNRNKSMRFVPVFLITVNSLSWVLNRKWTPWWSHRIRFVHIYGIKKHSLAVTWTPQIVFRKSFWWTSNLICRIHSQRFLANLVQFSAFWRALILLPHPKRANLADKISSRWGYPADTHSPMGSVLIILQVCLAMGCWSTFMPEFSVRYSSSLIKTPKKFMF